MGAYTCICTNCENRILQEIQKKIEDRVAFQVDQELKVSAQKAAKALDEEKCELRFNESTGKFEYFKNGKWIVIDKAPDKKPSKRINEIHSRYLEIESQMNQSTGLSSTEAKLNFYIGAIIQYLDELYDSKKI